MRRLLLCGLIAIIIAAVWTDSSLAIPLRQRIKLALWDYDDYQYDKEIIRQFVKANPQIAVEVVSFPNQEFDDKLAISLVSGDDIDLFYARTSMVYSNRILAKQARSIDDLIARDRLNLKPYGKIPDILKVDGKTYGLPYRTDIFALYYNRDIFDEAGVPYPTNDMTWEEYRATARRLTRGTGSHKIYGAFDFPAPLTVYYLPGLQRQKGNNLITSDLVCLKPGIELFYNMEQVDKSAIDYATNRSLNSDQAYFERGNSAMFICGTWMSFILASDHKAGKHNINWGVATIPHWKDGEKSTLLVATPICINTRTANLNAAWQFVKFAAGKPGAQIIASTLQLPGYIDPDIFKILNSHPDFFRGCAATLDRDSVFIVAPANKVLGLIRKIVEEEIQLIITNNKTIDQGIADMMRRRREILEQNSQIRHW